MQGLTDISSMFTGIGFDSNAIDLNSTISPCIKQKD